ncbi:hypothetical protein NQ314_009308 [Rhamnusium bicolor]|uniref:Myb-like domain-containing protein n=1 Tax=Rhamnusium bicolor TaxID=1586634 RepID=A0AAV8Y3K4_9CUCU|nr:hypothetical protein NQ314_009308 [Rhamnusium bicolor]
MNRFIRVANVPMEADTETSSQDDLQETPQVQDVVRKQIWTYENTVKLIAAVESNYDLLSHPEKRKTAWSDISNILIIQNVKMTSSECYKKWMNLLRTYKIVKDNKKKTGHGPVRFNFFSHMDEFLGSRLTNSSPHSIDVAGPCAGPSNIEPEEHQSFENETTKEIVNPNEATIIKRTKNATIDYFKAKKQYLERRQKMLEERRREEKAEREAKLRLMERKLELEERKVRALEEFVKLEKKRK